MRLSLIAMAASGRTLKCFLSAVFLTIWLTCPVVADTITLTSGSFSFQENAEIHAISFGVSGDDVSISGDLLDEFRGQSWACNFSGIGTTGCLSAPGSIELGFRGTNYRYGPGIDVALSPIFPNLIADPALGELFEPFIGALNISFANPCVTPLQNCLGESVSASGIVSGTVHYKALFLGSSFYRVDSAEGVVVTPEPGTMFLVLSGLVLAARRQKSFRRTAGYRTGTPAA